MPLIHSKKDSAVGTNIKRELGAGKPQEQAVAIALDVQREAKTKKSSNSSDLKLLELLINKGEGIECSCGKGLNCSCSKIKKAVGGVGPNSQYAFNPLGIGYNIGYGMGSEAGSSQLQAPNTVISAAAQAPRTVGRMMGRGGSFKEQQVQDAEQALNPQEGVHVPGVQYNPQSIPLPPRSEPSVPSTPPTVGPHFMDQVAAAAPAQPPPPSVGPGAGWNKQSTQAASPISAPPTTKLAPLVPQGPATPPAPKMPANLKLAPTNKPVDMSSQSENFGGNIGPALPQVHSSNIGPALVPPSKPIAAPAPATSNAFANAPKTTNDFKTAPRTTNDFKTAPKTVNEFANSPQTVKIPRPALPQAPQAAPKPAVIPRPSAPAPTPAPRPTPTPIAAPKATPTPMSAQKRGRGSPGGPGTGNPNRGKGGQFGYKKPPIAPQAPLPFPENNTATPPTTKKSWYSVPLSSTPFYLRSDSYDPNAILRSATTQTNRMYTSLADPIRDTLNNVVEDEQIRTHNTYKSCVVHGLLHKSNSVCPICRSSQEFMRSPFDPFGGMKTNLK
jgi:hypothetical protein